MAARETGQPGETDGQRVMRDILRRVAVGPSGSRDLGEQEAREAMALCLTREATDIQIAVFLIAERLKRETDEENLGFLRALCDASAIHAVAVPRVVSIADPYDGFNRTPHFGPVVAAVLGACGLPAYVHGARDTAPKHGITGRQVLEAMSIDLGTGRGEASLAHSGEMLGTHGAAYVDVEDFCPALHGLSGIRVEIAKRPCLATLEKLVTPLRGTAETHVVSGWVHEGYQQLMTQLLSAQGMTSSLLVKGREGHTDPHVHRDTVTCGQRPGGERFEEIIEPKCYGVQITEVPDWGDLSAESIAGVWDEALHRKHRTWPGQTVRLLAGMVLSHTGTVSTIMRGVGLAHEAILSGRAREALFGMGGG